MCTDMSIHIFDYVGRFGVTLRNNTLESKTNRVSLSETMFKKIRPFWNYFQKNSFLK